MDNLIEILRLTPHLEWGAAVPQYFFFTGISAAAFLLSSLTYVFGKKKYAPIAGLSLVVALTVLLAAPLNLIADLAQPGRFYSLLLRRHITSPMSWGVFLLTAYPLLIALEMLFAFRARFARRAGAAAGWRRALYTLLALGQPQVTPATERRDHRASRLLGIVGIPLALAVHGYTGFILYFVVGRPLWNTPLMPIIFLVSAIVSGIGFMLLLSWLLVRDRQGRVYASLLERMGLLLGWSILLDLALRLLWHGWSYVANPAIYGPILEILFRERFVESVLLEIVLFLVVPATIAFLPTLRRRPRWLLVAALLTVAGVWFFRWATVIGGQEIAKISAGTVEMEVPLWGGKGWMQVVANWAFWLFLFTLATWFLPWQQRAEKPASATLPPAGRPAAAD